MLLAQALVKEHVLAVYNVGRGAVLEVVVAIRYDRSSVPVEGREQSVVLIKAEIPFLFVKQSIGVKLTCKWPYHRSNCLRALSAHVLERCLLLTNWRWRDSGFVAGSHAATMEHP